MGKSKQDFADVRMTVEYYHALDEEIKQGMELRKIHCEGWDEEYKSNPKWVEQKKLASYNEYKKLKDIEFEIRNKTNK